MPIRPADDPRSKYSKTHSNTPSVTYKGSVEGNTGVRSSGAKEPPVYSSDLTQLDEGIPGHRAVWIRDPETGQWYAYAYNDMVDAGYMPGNLTQRNFNEAVKAAQAVVDSEFSKSSGGGRSGGYSRGGSSGSGLLYQAPDERLVREAIRSTLAALTGRIDSSFLDSLVKTYLSEDKKAFDVRETKQLDPMETVKEKIRATGEYKAIHKLRPQSVDEMEWVTTRQGALKRAGVTDVTAESLGIAQATAGSSDAETVQAGNISTFSQSGELLDDLKNRIRTASYGALRLV